MVAGLKVLISLLVVHALEANLNLGPPLAASGMVVRGSTTGPGRSSVVADQMRLAAAADPAASTQWDGIVAAAKKEGALMVSGPVGPQWRDALTAFVQDYPNINLEFSGLSTTQFWARLSSERKAGQFLWDLQVGGVGPDTFDVRDKGILDPVRPLLILPEVVDERKWLGGLDALFLDKEKRYVLGFLANVQNNVFVNREVIRESDLSSAKDLLNPRWKGKIAVQEPRQSGAGNAMLAVLLKTEGETFVRNLLKMQEVSVTPDYRQLTEWVVRGRYPIVVGSSRDFLRPFLEQGVGRNVASLKEPLTLSSGNGGIKLINRSPHPNAARLFVNWLLTRNTQARVVQKVAYNSRRLDVPPFDPAAAADPARLNEYAYDQYEDMMKFKQRAIDLAKEILP